MEVGGATAGTGFDLLAVTGTATLDGTLNLRLINGFTPFNGETFEILSSRGLSGVFSTINGLVEGNFTFSVDYGRINPNGVTLTANLTAVPEPTSLLMLGLGLVGLGVLPLRQALARRLGNGDSRTQV